RRTENHQHKVRLLADYCIESMAARFFIISFLELVEVSDEFIGCRFPFFCRYGFPRCPVHRPEVVEDIPAVQCDCSFVHVETLLWDHMASVYHRRQARSASNTLCHRFVKKSRFSVWAHFVYA